MDQKVIENVVREVLTEVLGPTMPGNGWHVPQSDRATRFETATQTVYPERPRPRTEQTPDAGKNAGRKLAEENIARWLGRETGAANEPRKRDWPGAKSLPPLTPKEKVDEYREKSTVDQEKNLIPEPRKPEKLLTSLSHTPARIGVWRAGTRYLTRVALKLRADHAVAKDAVYADLPKEFAAANGWVQLNTKAKSKEEFLLRPDLGRQLDEASLKIVQEKAVKQPDIQITVADGLSSWAAERYAVPMVKELVSLCQQNGYTVGTIFCVKYSRIAIQDVIGEAVGAKISIILLGERPGLGTGDSLSNYMVYGPKVGIVNAKKSMISNIHPAGHKPEEAARITVNMFKKMFEQKCSGVDLHV